MAEYRHLLDYIVVEYVALMDISTQKRPVNFGVVLIDRQELTKALAKNKYLPFAENRLTYFSSRATMRVMGIFPLDRLFIFFSKGDTTWKYE